MRKIRLTFILSVLIILSPILPHSGRTDSNGGHNNRKTGGYHYHNSGSSYKSSNSYKSYDTNRVRQISTKVLFIQSSLKLLGFYYSTLDGFDGKNTRAAIRSFQKAEGIYQSGLLDDDTKIALLRELNTVSFKTN